MRSGKSSSPYPRRTSRIAGDSRPSGSTASPAPVHASHHISIQHDDGTLYAGDSLGVRIAPASFVLAPTPPPDIDLEAWEETVIASERRGPSRLALTHFGVFEDVPEHLAGFRETLARWAERVAHGMDEATFVAAASADYRAADPGEIEPYDLSAPYAQCFLGLERYWRKRAEAAQAR